jgi:hypothetical protein
MPHRLARLHGLYTDFMPGGQNPHGIAMPPSPFIGPSCNEADGWPMLDAILIVAALAFFLVACGYAILCERV